MSKQQKKEMKLETAEFLMSRKFPIIQLNSTVKQVKDFLQRKTKNFETINYLYVCNQKNNLMGVISIKDVFRNKPEAKIQNFMKKDLIFAKLGTDQEKVALLALKHGLKEVPVLNKENQILGVVTFKKLMQILHQEHIEDLLREAGIHKFKDPAVEIISAPCTVHVKKRLPWLVLGLLGGIFAALIIHSFESMLDKYILLAAFIPAVVYMADAVGAQAQTIFIRSMALDRKLNISKYAFREVKINLMLGLILGLLFYLVFFIVWKDPLFGMIIGVSIFTTVLVSMVVSIVMPLIFQKLKSDPAISSGPFATSVRDLTSLMVYFGIANVLIKIFS